MSDRPVSPEAAHHVCGAPGFNPRRGDECFACSPPLAAPPRATTPRICDKCGRPSRPEWTEARCEWCVSGWLRATTPEPISDERLVERAEKHLRDLCNGDERWRMCVPVHPDDSDEIFGAVIRRLKELLAAKRLRATLASSPSGAGTPQPTCPKCGGPIELWQQEGRRYPAIRCLRNGCTWPMPEADAPSGAGTDIGALLDDLQRIAIAYGYSSTEANDRRLTDNRAALDAAIATLTARVAEAERDAKLGHALREAIKDTEASDGYWLGVSARDVFLRVSWGERRDTDATRALRAALAPARGETPTPEESSDG